MLNYNEQLMTARCWDKCVDYASPMSAWTLEMILNYENYKREQDERRNKIR